MAALDWGPLAGNEVILLNSPRGSTTPAAIATLASTAPAISGGTANNVVIGGTTPAAGTFTALASTGNTTVAGYALRSVGNALTAAGTTRADALQLAKEINRLTTAGASTGVILPVGVVGMRITLFNDGANAVKVYATASETVDGTAGATGVALTNAKRAHFFFVAANTWISAQLGVVSA